MRTPYDIHLTDEHLELYESTRKLATDVLAPVADAGEPGTINRPLIRALGEHGILPRVFNGAKAIDLCLMREALARGCTDAETALAVQGLSGYPIMLHASPAVREEWVPRIIEGTVVSAFALTEPDAGSDVAALTLRAVRDGDDYRLTGEKLWISHAPDADVFTVFARTGDERRHVTAFVVPRESDGLSGEARKLLVPHAIGSLTFDGVRVPAENVIGEPGAGFRTALRTLDLFRPSVGAFAIGMSRHAMELTVEHVKTRHTFGKALKDHQAVAHRLADLSARVNAARLLVHQAAFAHDAGQGDTALASMSKLLATETAQEVVDAAVQFHGARGLEEGHPLEHLYREVRPPRIYEGASEIHREIIARSLFR